MDGLILSSSRLQDEQIAHTADAATVALMNRFHPEPRVLSGAIQDEVVRLAAEHLVSLGHTALPSF